MSKFKVGDKVVRTLCSFGSLVVGAEYTVKLVSDYVGTVQLVGHSGAYRIENFELVKEEKPDLTPRKHQKEIIAWANGATIQYWCTLENRWIDSANNHPSWSTKRRYRVKPDNTAEIEKEITDLQWSLENRLEEVAKIKAELDLMKRL